MAVMWLQCISVCGNSKIKVRRKYLVSKAHIKLKYGKSTVNYGKSIVLYGNFVLVPTVHIYSTHHRFWNRRTEETLKSYVCFLTTSRMLNGR